MRVLSIALLLAWQFSAVAEAKEFPLWEMGPGDFGFRDICEPGTYILGFHARIGAWFDAIGVHCGVVLPSGENRITSSKLTRGGGGGRASEMMCENGQVVGALRFGQSDDGKKLGKLFMWCKVVSTGQLISEPLVFTGQENSGVYNRANFDQDCGGEVAVGLKGRAGRDVNALGLICGPYTPPAPTTSTALAPGGGRMLSCGVIITAKSRGGGPNVTLQFHNGGSASRLLEWFNDKGTLIRYAQIGPGQTYPQPTFSGHFWALLNDRGECTMIYQAGSVSETVEVR